MLTQYPVLTSRYFDFTYFTKLDIEDYIVLIETVIFLLYQYRTIFLIACVAFAYVNAEIVMYH